MAGALAACASGAPPEPGESRLTPPDLRGRTVMVLPVQELVGVQGTPDAELAFQLEDREPGIDWVFPDRIERALQRSPGIQAEPRGLPVGAFLTSEVRRVGDPLYGELRRMAALVDADVALIPVRLGVRGTADGGTALGVHAALVEVRTGRVVWYGLEEGSAGDPADPSTTASAVDALARRLLWYSAR